jgi:hypothetical protein
MLRKLLAAAIFMPTAIACAPLVQAQEYNISPERVSLVDQTCLKVLGLKRGETYFADCRESLSHALAARDEGHAMAIAYADCNHRGLAEGTAAFSTCMPEVSKPVPASPQLPAIASTGGAETEVGKSFYDVAPHVQFNRERYACAQLGPLPGSLAFGQCVTSLQGAFLPEPN